MAALVAPIAKTEAPKLPDATTPAEMKAAPADGKTTATQPGAVQPDAMRPAQAKKATKVIQKTKPTRRLKPGDLICGECGEGNPPARKFCSRCGTSLDAAKLVKKKWWQKLIPKRKVKTLEVGERPGQGGVKGKKARKPLGRMFRRVLGIGALVVTLLFTFVAPFRSWVQDSVFQPVKDKYHDLTTQDFDPVATLNPTSTSEYPEFPILQAFDGFSNTAWHGPFTESHIIMTVNFQEPIDIDRAIVRNGDFENPTGLSRPKTVHLIFNTGETYDFVLKDGNEPETYDINNAAGVTSIQIEIIDLYQSPQNPDVAVTEWEWFTET